ncbi:MAG TPA: zinc ribbon domain-containing protein [candidate division WOR-3 bacterium]|uniref:Zinc ribbon domain-containing protein n=1 Tax=candidate division WOR-3 bacterium TaxID=2052148 RepID=A0A7V0XFN4_UNCW3|nr:zinc ribbon domain-containing protein [candidate division WOR-3 bacterium]
MPTYEYQCRKCGHRFEVFQRIVDPPVRNCPKCRGRGSVEQLISGGSGLIFKGSGFYITDYKNKSGGGSPGAGKSPDKKPDTGSSTTFPDKPVKGDGKSGSTD